MSMGAAEKWRLLECIENEACGLMAIAESMDWINGCGQPNKPRARRSLSSLERDGLVRNVDGIWCVVDGWRTKMSGLSSEELDQLSEQKDDHDRMVKIAMTAEEAARFKALGGTRWLRAMLENQNER